MQVRKGKPPGSGQLARTGVELSREARVRLQWMDFYHRCRNVARTCRHFGISRQTFYGWLRRYDAFDLTTLKATSHRPHRRRQPTWSSSLEGKVLLLRLQFPRWGKDKLAVLLRQEKLLPSTSMVGRILTHLKRQGRLLEPPRSGVPGSRRALRPRPYAIRKPKQYAVSEPGNLVKVDTLEVRPIPGVVFKQFTARDVVSRWDVIQAHTNPSITRLTLCDRHRCWLEESWAEVMGAVIILLKRVIAGLSLCAISMLPTSCDSAPLFSARNLSAQRCYVAER